MIKIKGFIQNKEEKQYENLSTFINHFGYIEYQIGNQIKIVNLNTKNIRPSKTTIQNECYIETTKELRAATKINLVFKIRNKTYKYVVK